MLIVSAYQIEINFIIKLTFLKTYKREGENSVSLFCCNQYPHTLKEKKKKKWKKRKRRKAKIFIKIKSGLKSGARFLFLFIYF